MTNEDIRDRLAAYREATADRDGLVRDAAAAGISNREISKLSGISRPTVINIVGKRETWGDYFRENPAHPASDARLADARDALRLHGEG